MIYIYSDGIHTNDHLYMAVQEAISDTFITFCTASMILDGCLDEKCSLLIMPGGADLFYCEKLNGTGNLIIREYINNGGSYLGICAGAYYGSSALNWNNGEIAGTRELAFYQGCATGPVYDWIENSNSVYDGSWKKATKIETDGGYSLLTLYDGGPVLDEPTNTNAHVIARYSDLSGNPPAIVEGTFGKGRYILSSPHIERFGHRLDDQLYTHRNKSYEREKKVIEELLSYENEQRDFFNAILSKL